MEPYKANPVICTVKIIRKESKNIMREKPQPQRKTRRDKERGMNYAYNSKQVMRCVHKDLTF